MKQSRPKCQNRDWQI